MSIVLFLFKGQYSMYLNNEISKFSLINMVIYSSLIFFILWFYNKFNSDYQLFIKIFMIGVFFLPIGFILPLSSRLALYLLPLSIIIYPKLLELIKITLIKQLFIIAVIAVFSMRLITFFFSETYSPHYFNYTTIFKTLF